MVDIEIQLGDYLDAFKIPQTIKRSAYCAFGVVFDRHDAVFGLFLHELRKYGLDSSQRQIRAHRTKTTLRSLMCICALRPQVGYLLRRFEVSADGKNFKIDGLDGGFIKWAVLARVYEAAYDGSLAFWPINGRATGLF